MISLSRPWGYLASPVFPCLSSVSSLYRLAFSRYRLPGRGGGGAAGVRDRSRLPHFFAHTPPPQRVASPIPNYRLCLPSPYFISLFFVAFHLCTFAPRHPRTCRPPVTIWQLAAPPLHRYRWSHRDLSTNNRFDRESISQSATWAQDLQPPPANHWPDIASWPIRDERGCAGR